VSLSLATSSADLSEGAGNCPLSQGQEIAMKIIYEPHPVTPERKAELRAAGFKIIDAVFAPDDTEPKPAPASPKRRGKVKGAD
jgi:hypothetical protein